MNAPDLVGLLSEEYANPLKGACPTEAGSDAQVRARVKTYRCAC
jgi:hypothetical protein